MLNLSLKSRGGHLYLKLDIILVKKKKNHVIGVVFRDQAKYARTLFMGAKTCKIWKKGVFLVIVTHFGKDMKHKLRKTPAKARIKGLFSYLKILGCVLKVLLRGWYPAWNTSAPPQLKGVLHLWALFLKTLCIFSKNKATLDKVSYRSGHKCCKEFKNHSFTSVETIVVKLQWKMCENQYFPCFEP